MLQEQLGDADRLVEEPARIVAQIDHDSAQLVAHLAHRLAQRALEARRGVRVEAGEPDGGDIAVARIADRRRYDESAGEDDLARCLVLGGEEGHVHRAADRPAQAVDHVVEGEIADGLAVDLHEEVVGRHAGFRRRPLLQDRDNANVAAVLLDGEADPAEALALGALVAGRRRRRVAGEGIEALERPAEHGVVDGLDVGVPHRLGELPGTVEHQARGDRPGDRIVVVRGREIQHSAVVVGELQAPSVARQLELRVDRFHALHAGKRQLADRYRLEVALGNFAEAGAELLAGHCHEGAMRGVGRLAASGEPEDQGEDERKARARWSLSELPRRRHGCRTLAHSPSP